MRIAILILVAMISACAVEATSEQVVRQSEACSPDCFPGDDGDWIDPSAPEAQPAVDLLLTATNNVAVTCKWDVGEFFTCVSCQGPVIPGGHHGGGQYYGCSVCTLASLNGCGLYSVLK